MSNFKAQIEKAAIDAIKKQVTDKVGRMRCRTHQKAPSIRFSSGSKPEAQIVNICCDEFRAQVLQALRR